MRGTLPPVATVGFSAKRHSVSATQLCPISARSQRQGGRNLWLLFRRNSHGQESCEESPQEEGCEEEGREEEVTLLSALGVAFVAPQVTNEYEAAGIQFRPLRLFLAWA